MKHRQGFVSNSSSSSFVIKTDSPFQLAADMLKVVYDEWSGYNDGDVEIQKLDKAFTRYGIHLNNLCDKLPKGCDGIVLPSTNYDTYILFEDKEYTDASECFVYTCNNHDWEHELEYSLLNFSEQAEGLLHRLVSKCYFYDVHNGMVLHYPIYSDYICPKCKEKYYFYHLTQDGKKVCGLCYAIMDSVKNTQSSNLGEIVRTSAAIDDAINLLEKANERLRSKIPSRMCK